MNEKLKNTFGWISEIVIVIAAFVLCVADVLEYLGIADRRLVTFVICLGFLAWFIRVPFVKKAGGAFEHPRWKRIGAWVLVAILGIRGLTAGGSWVWLQIRDPAHVKDIAAAGQWAGVWKPKPDAKVAANRQVYVAPIEVSNYNRWSYGGIRVKIIMKDGYRLIKLVPKLDPKRALPFDEQGLAEESDDKHGHVLFQNFSTKVGWQLEAVVELVNPALSFGSDPPFETFVDLLE